MMSRTHTQLHFPWLSALAALLLAGYLLAAAQPFIFQAYSLPEAYFSGSWQLSALALFCLVLLIDMWLFQRKLRLHRLEMRKLNARIDELVLAKKQLQNKAHTFAGHADKLKFFISDRLLEYIEYDEKFLHFKSIAAEVRHNGVICFDKVQTALQASMQGADEDRRHICQDAMDQMSYLWDLLELSTTDNLALHIAGQLCELEEQYCQLLLQDQTLGAGMSAPTFTPQRAAVRALNSFLEHPLPTDDAGGGSDKSDETELTFSDTHLQVCLQPAEALLGKENHVVLLLENMINNALFFAGKKGFRHKYARTAVHLQQGEQHARFLVYNHGPHISDDDRQHIFQLGYSTRRAQHNHGKGLGLYFVNEIVKGYEGRIDVENIHNSEGVFSIRIAYSDGSVLSEVLETRLEDGQLLCKSADSAAPVKTVEWSAKARVSSVEIALPGRHQTWSFSEMDSGDHHFVDPADSLIQRWAIDVTQRPRSSKVCFVPLDVSGVCFRIELPTARARLDYSDAGAVDDLEEDELAQLRGRFRAPGIREAG